MAKRGFCAVCDARFDLLPELFIGEGPMRSLMVPQAAELSKPPTSKMREIETGHFLVKQAGANSMTVAFALTSVMFTFGGILMLLGRGPRFFGVTMLTMAGLIGVICAWFAASSEEVRVEAGRIIVRRGIGRFVRTTQRPLADIERFSVSSLATSNNQVFRVVKGIIPGEDPLVIGAGLGHSEEAMTWLARRLEKALREVRK